MYGTVARMRVKPGMADRLALFSADSDDLQIPGFIGTYVYRMDKDPDEFYLVVMFDDKATYSRNAEDPAQDRRYLELRELLAEDPEWHDGEIAWASSGTD
jgi:heme-degrading monooxygenase HmoA